LNAVVGLAYYVRVAAVLFAAPAAEAAQAAGPVEVDERGRGRTHWAVAAALGAATVVALVVGFAPQLVLDAASLVGAGVGAPR
ncbi:MAG: hypothetical protein IRY92_09765, partial [Dactylosporangium sp.]|nr:hypothetical protein [Dactylosporangium sp.]